MTNIANLSFFLTEQSSERQRWSVTSLQRLYCVRAAMVTCISKPTFSLFDPAKQQSEVVLWFFCYLLEKKDFVLAGIMFKLN